jgi:DNA-directed RNA polymerase specialized sigma24 family protein
MGPAMLTTSNKLHFIVASANRAAARLYRRHQLPWLEPDDIRQDLLLDLLCRLPHYDEQRSTLVGFATVCFQHRSSRLDARLRRERRRRHPVSLDAPAAGVEGLTLADTLSIDDGYGTWIGQRSNQVEDAELHLDLDRALSTLPSEALDLCAVLMQSEPNPAGCAGISRTTLHRRVWEIRCHLLAAGVGDHLGTDHLVAG